MSPTDQPEIPPAALLLTKVAMAEALAAACALSAVPVEVVPTEIGAVAVCRATGVGDTERAARLVSRTLRNTPVLLLVQREGRMTAARWAGGQPVADLAPALVLDGAPPEIEQLLLGRLVAADLPGVVTSTGMSRWRALRILASVARARRRR